VKKRTPKKGPFGGRRAVSRKHGPGKDFGGFGETGTGGKGIAGGML